MRKQQINNLISKLRDPKTNQIKYDPKDIESIFKNYYEKLQPQIRKSWDSMENANKKRK